MTPRPSTFLISLLLFVLSFNSLCNCTTFVVDDFGGGSGDNTQAFKNAWDRVCSTSGKAILVVPHKKYLVKPIKFEGPCKFDHLTVEIQGTIEASDDRSDYIYGRHWLVFDGVQDLLVQGGGTLNGNGDVWWRHSCKINKSLPCKEAPTALTFHKCENLVMKNINVLDAQQIQVSFDHCNHVKASNLTITAPEHSPNTDGIHITNSQDVEISNSVIGTGDDCISIVSGTKTVRATNITCGPGHGISIGSLGSGNSEAHVSDVIVNGAKLYGTTNGVRIKTWQGGSGSARNITFQNIEMNNVHNPIIIDQNYCDQKRPCKEKSSAVQVEDILYKNITGTSASKVAIQFDCSESSPCKGIELQNIDIQYNNKDKTKAMCQNVELTDIRTVSPLCPNHDSGKNNNNNSHDQGKGNDNNSHDPGKNNDNNNRGKNNDDNNARPSVKKPRVVNVEDHGAMANGNDDSKAFKKAWEEACSSNDPAFLVVPQKHYLVKPVKFEGPCKSNLTIQIHGTIEASKDRSDYDGYGRHWLNFESVQNLTVEGGGALNGNGNIWWKHSCKINKSLPCKEAPTALIFGNCENLIVRNLTVKDSQQMQVSFDSCKKVKASNLTVTAPKNSPNTDGIHVTNTQDIEISNCVIGTGDDCISIVSGSKNVTARDITCGPGHGISIGSLGANNSEAHISNVFVNKVKFYGTTNGVRIKTWQGGSGSARHIRFQDIEMHNVHNPIIIDQNYCDRKKPCKERSSAVQVEDVLYQNIKGTSSSKVAIRLDCSKSFECKGIVLQDIELQSHRGDIVQAFCKNVKLMDIGHVAPPCPN